MGYRKCVELKLKEDFFQQKEIKKLRKIAGGDAYAIIYLKLQLFNIKNGGGIMFGGIGDSSIERLSLELEEEAEDIKATLIFLEKYNLIERFQEGRRQK